MRLSRGILDWGTL